MVLLLSSRLYLRSELLTDPWSHATLCLRGHVGHVLCHDRSKSVTCIDLHLIANVWPATYERYRHSRSPSTIRLPTTSELVFEREIANWRTKRERRQRSGRERLFREDRGFLHTPLDGDSSNLNPYLKVAGICVSRRLSNTAD